MDVRILLSRLRGKKFDLVWREQKENLPRCLFLDESYVTVFNGSLVLCRVQRKRSLKTKISTSFCSTW